MRKALPNQQETHKPKEKGQKTNTTDQRKYKWSLNT